MAKQQNCADCVSKAVCRIQKSARVLRMGGQLADLAERGQEWEEFAGMLAERLGRRCRHFHGESAEVSPGLS
jgi:hypothetical protein